MKEIVLTKASKYFSPSQFLFKDLSFSFHNSHIFAIKGKNGSGKSTLLHTLIGLSSLDQGTITYSVNSSTLPQDLTYKHFAFASPSILFPEEMTTISFLSWIHYTRPLIMTPNAIIQHFNLEHIANTKLKNLSSGMLQRIKLIQAFLMQSHFLLLDEPCMNLDKTGIQLYYKLIQHFQQERLLIIASNDERELQFEHQTLFIEDFQ